MHGVFIAGVIGVYVGVEDDLNSEVSEVQERFCLSSHLLCRTLALF